MSVKKTEKKRLRTKYVERERYKKVTGLKEILCDLLEGIFLLSSHISIAALSYSFLNHSFDVIYTVCQKLPSVF